MPCHAMPCHAEKARASHRRMPRVTPWRALKIRPADSPFATATVCPPRTKPCVPKGGPEAEGRVQHGGVRRQRSRAGGARGVRACLPVGQRGKGSRVRHRKHHREEVRERGGWRDTPHTDSKHQHGTAGTGRPEGSSGRPLARRRVMTGYTVAPHRTAPRCSPNSTIDSAFWKKRVGQSCRRLHANAMLPTLAHYGT